MEHIKVTIKGAEISWVVRGVKGKGCIALTKDLQKLSAKVIESKPTSEMEEGDKPKDNRLTNGL
jgi:Protein of unknown function (DUF2997)